MSLRSKALLALALLLTVAPGTARADDAAAEAAFRRGQELLEKKQYEQACRAFEESYREDPAIGAQLNTARCYEQWGKLATALRAYREALRLVREVKDRREADLVALLGELEPKVPTLVVSLPAGQQAPEELALSLDGTALPLTALGKPQLLDPGEHSLVVRLGEGEPRSFPIAVRVRERATLEIPGDALVAAEQPEPEPEPAPAAPRSRARRWVALGLAGAGVATVGVGMYLALDARSSYQAAFDTYCFSDTKECTAVGLERTADARRRAHWGTAATGVGLAAIAAGVVLFVTAPRDEERAPRAALTPVVWRDGGGVVLSGKL